LQHLRKHCFDISLKKCESKGRSNAGWYKIEQSRLRVTVNMHDENGRSKSSNVRKERGVEVGATVAVQAMNKK
jgi:hypothetical protein